MDRINTCISLFFGYNEIERMVDEQRKFNIKLNALDPENSKKYQNNWSKDIFSEEEKQTVWYKMIQENNQRYKASNDRMIKMIISLCALIIGLNKEELISKNKHDFDVLVRQNDFDNTIYNWAKKKNGKICVGDIEFANSSECLQFVRNKLLHGDYFIKNQFIFFKKNSKIGKINYEDLLISCNDFIFLSKCHDKSIERSMVLYQKNDRIRRSNRFFSDEIYDVKLKFQIKGKREISINDLNLILDIEDYIYEYNINNKFAITKSIELALKKHESDLASHHLNIDFDIIPYSEKKLDEVRHKLNEAFEYYRRNYCKEKPSFEDIFQYFNLNNQNNSKEYFNDCFYALALFLKGSMKRNWASKSGIEDQRAIDRRDINSALDILKFYCFFNYGLDDILFSSEEISLRSIFNGEYFDYSKLDLSLFDDPNMRCDVTFGSYGEQLQGISSEYERSRAAYLSKKEIYDKYIEKHGHSNPNIEQKIKAPLDYLEDCYNTNKRFFEMSKDFDINKYVRNLNIIYHIRNSIAHGNYEIDNDDIQNVNYVFNDIYEGNVNYSLSINAKDFRKLFDYKDLISSFYDGIAGEYTIEDLYDNEIYYDCMYVRSEKRDSWNKYVENVLDNGDGTDKRILNLTHLVLENINNPSGHYDSIDDFKECVNANRNNFLGLATLSIEQLQNGVLIDGEKYSVNEYERMLKNILVYDEFLYRNFCERRITDGDERSLLKKVLVDLQYKGCLPNYYRGKK